MKKLLSILAAAVLIFTGCQQTVQPTLSMSTIINSGKEEVDLSNKTCTEDVTVTKAVTIKNGDFGGKTLTVNVSGVTLESAKNVNVVVAEAVGDGDFTVSGSNVASLKVLGVGANSIHVKDTVLKVINIAKENVRVALEGKSNVTKLQLKKGVTAKVEVKSSDVKVEAAEVVSEDGTKVEGESVQIAVDDGVTFTAPTGSVKKPADTHKHSYGDWKTEKEPTCTEKGKKKRTCSCGNEETEEIAAKGHSFEDGWTTDSTGHWHKSTCGHDEEKSGYGEHKDEDNDGACDVCSYDMTADWSEPTFEFDQSGSDFLPFKDSVSCPMDHAHLKTDDVVPVITPKIKVEPETGNKIIFFTDSGIGYKNNPDTDGWEWRQLDTNSYYIRLKDPEIGDGTCYSYILYDELKDLCNKNHIRMTTDDFQWLATNIDNIATVVEE